MTTADPFAFGRRVPTILLYLLARRPLVHASKHHFDLRMDYLDVARAKYPCLYLDGIDLALMGGQPYSDWN